MNKLKDHTSMRVRKCFPIEIGFELEFCINEAKIYTTDRLPNSQEEANKTDSNETNFLVIEIWTQLDAIESVKNVHLYTRPTILILLSVISYLSDHPLTIYENISMGMNTTLDEKPNKIEVSKTIYNQIDKSRDLIKILKSIYMKEENINEFLVSVLSRWHKARYLEDQSDASLYYEEGFLVYFHIMELFSNSYRKEQIDEAQEKIEDFSRELLSNTLKLRDNNLEQVCQEKYKAVRSILLSDGQIPITSRICYLLDRVGLLDLKTQYFVEQLVKIRNTIAHGRHVNHKKLSYPLPPFLSINSDVEKFICEIRVFTGRVIGAYLSIEAWSDEWTDVHHYLHPPPEYVKRFIRNASFQSIAPTDFVEGTIDGVRPSSLTENFLLKKIKLREFEMGLKLFLLDVEVDQDNAFEVFEAAVILADSHDEALSCRCRNIVADIHKNRLVWYSNIKDILREIEQHKVNLNWFRSWIESGGHRAK
ncbi:MAG: hypothetical protein AB8B99_09750 [Phormidesmis sp.]